MGDRHPLLEMAKRARTFVRPAELLILGGLIHLFVGSTPVEAWRQHIVQSDAARSFGLDNSFVPFAPTDPEILDSRNF